MINPFIEQRGLRLDLVFRTSERKRDGQSITQQRQQAQGICASGGHKIVFEHDSGRSESGKTMDRESLRLAEERRRQGLTDGIVVGYLDRLGRAPIEESMTFVRALVADDGALVAADWGPEKIVLNSNTEDMVVFRLQMNRSQWLKAKERYELSRENAVEKGKYVGSAVTGFDKMPKDHPDPKLRGRLVKNADAPFMRRVILAAGRDGLAAAQDMLAERWPDGRWDADTVRKLLASPAYKGWSKSGKYINRKAHDWIVTEAQWKAAQHEAGPRRPNGEYPLSGIATCECGAPMVGQLKSVPGRERSYRTMRCSATAHVSISADNLEARIRDELRPLVDGGWFVVEFGDAELQDAEARLERARDEKQEFTSDIEYQRELGRDGRMDMLRALNAAIAEAEDKLEKAAGQAARASQKIPSAADLDTPKGLATLAGLAARRAPIVVHGGRGPIEQRVSFSVRDDSAGVLAA